MEILWRDGEKSAKELALLLKDEVGWSKTTTYTVIKKCVDKGVLVRSDPGFMCRALLSRVQAQETETAALIDRLYDGSADRLVASLLGNARLSTKEIERLRAYVREIDS